jgi:hypothetical protein
MVTQRKQKPFVKLVRPPVSDIDGKIGNDTDCQKNCDTRQDAKRSLPDGVPRIMFRIDVRAHLNK